MSKILEHILLVLISLHIFALYYSNLNYLNTDFRHNTEQYVNKTAYKPFAYRVLHVAIADVIVSILPQKFIDNIQKHQFYDNLVVKFRIKQYLIPHILIFLFTNLVFLYFGLVLYFKVHQEIYNTNDAKSLISTIGFAYSLPFYFFPVLYPYDLNCIFFTLLCIYALLRKRFSLFVVAIFLGILNKETLILFLPAWFLYNYSENKTSTFYIRGLIVFLSAVLARIYTLVIFANNNGVVMENHFSHNLDNLLSLNPYNSPTVFLTISAIILIFYRFNAIPRILQELSYLIVCYSILYIFGGHWRELRIFMEISPLLFLIVTHCILCIINSAVLPSISNEQKQPSNILRLTKYAISNSIIKNFLLAFLICIIALLFIKYFLISWIRDLFYIPETQYFQINSISQVVEEEGSMWDAPENTIITPNQDLVIQFEKKYKKPKSILLSLDGNDAYKVCFELEEKQVTCEVLGPKTSVLKGMANFKLEYTNVVFDQIRIRPLFGDLSYSLGYLVVEE